MTITTIAARVTELVARTAGKPADTVTPQSRLAEDLGMESLDTVECSMDLEDEFAIQIADEDIARLKTVGDVIAYVEQRRHA